MIELERKNDECVKQIYLICKHPSISGNEISSFQNLYPSGFFFFKNSVHLELKDIVIYVSLLKGC